MKCLIQDLVTWNESKLTDPSTAKGVAAELAACIGLDMVRQTILEFSA